MENVVQQTTEYKKFSLLGTNRTVQDAHVQSLKKAMEEEGNLTKIVPVLINERHQIIDGQHRFAACKELGLPVFYTMVKGLGIKEARAMNILQKNWSVSDYAKSYAETGNRMYIKYLQLKENYNFSHGAILHALTGKLAGRSTPVYKEFKEGNLSFTEEQFERAKDILNKLSEISEYTNVTGYKIGALAFLRAIKAKDYDHETMIKRLKTHGKNITKGTSTIEVLREIEEVFNWHVPENKRKRLF